MEKVRIKTITWKYLVPALIIMVWSLFKVN
jgi:hypothetical protein